MNKRADRLFAVILDNKILCINTTLKKFHVAFADIEKKSPSYITLYRRFHPDPNTEILYFELTIDDKTYHFQKLV